MSTFKYVVALVVVLAAGRALADETDSYCDYTVEKSKAEQLLLQTPKLEFSGGRGSVGTVNVAGLGLQSSLSQYLKGNLSHQVGQADCELYRHVSELQKHVNYDVTQMKVSYEQARIDFIDGQIMHLEQIISQEDSRLKDGTSTVVTIDTVNLAIARMRAERTTLAQDVALTILPEHNDQPLRKLIAETRELQSTEQHALDKQSTYDNWDVSLGFGEGSPINTVHPTGPYTPYISLSASVSFGLPWRNRAIHKSGEAFVKYEEETIQGPLYLAGQLHKVVDQALAVQTSTLRNNFDYLDSIVKSKDDMAKIDTIEAHRFLVQLEIDYSVNEVEYQSSKYAVSQFEKYLAINFGDTQ